MSKQPELGDVIETALTSIGVTKDRVTRWLGRPCGCAARREKLNGLSRWAKRILLGKTDNAEEYLNQLLEDAGAPPNPERRYFPPPPAADSSTAGPPVP